MSDNDHDLFSIDLTKLNLIGCGLFLGTVGCCCGGHGVVIWLIAVIVPEGGLYPRLVFALPWIGASVFFFIVRAGLEANNISRHSRRLYTMA